MTESAKRIESDVYLSFAGSLYRHRWPQVMAAVAHIVCFLVIYARSGMGFYLALTAAGVLVMALRLLLILRFAGTEHARLGLEEARRWERGHVAGSAANAALLGIGTSHSMLVGLDSFSVFICISVIMATMVSIAGRGYGSPLGIDLQLLLCCGPVVATSFVSGDIYVMIMCLLLVPLAVETRAMARDVRDSLSEKVTASHRLATVAERFDTALNTMPHGLIMLDGAKRVQMVNKRAREFFRLGDGDELEGRRLEEIVPAGASSGEADPRAGQVLRTQLSQFADGALGRAQVPFPGDLHLEFSGARRPDGSAVLIFEDVTARVQAETRILHMVRFDTLTGLPNRNHFRELMLEAVEGLEAGAPVGFMLIDVDELKHVNDMRGHAFGDRLLAQVGKRFKALAGADVLAARVISDQFGLLFTGKNEAELQARMLEFHAALQGGYRVGDIEMPLSFSGGYLILPNDAPDLDDWQIKADLALFEAKARSRGSCVGYAAEMDRCYIEGRLLKADLRRALENDELTTVYQPMYTKDGTRIECCEALVRWTHHERGAVRPDEFIRLAEEMGVVSSITRFVLDRACRDCAAWPSPIAVSVNLSVQDLRSREIVATVGQALATSGLAPSRLHLEVTESSLMDEPVTAGAILAELRGMGITIAIDDFGTGFSSLSYLDTLPLDVVKIDRSFVRNITGDPRRLKLLKGTVHLARELGLRVVVEGVETREQLSLIVKHRCADLVQGFVFSVPVQAQRIARLAEVRAEAKNWTGTQTAG